MKQGAFRHRPNSPYGENLYEVTSGQASPQQVVNAWAAEAADYGAAANTCKPGKMCGHYTQIVWRDTKQMGCAAAQAGNREVWVCEYSPPGNYTGMQPY